MKKRRRVKKGRRQEGKRRKRRVEKRRAEKRISSHAGLQPTTAYKVSLERIAVYRKGLGSYASEASEATKVSLVEIRREDLFHVKKRVRRVEVQPIVDRAYSGLDVKQDKQISEMTLEEYKEDRLRLPTSLTYKLDLAHSQEKLRTHEVSRIRERLQNPIGERYQKGKKEIKTVRQRRAEWVKRENGKRKEKEPREWSEEIVRVGTGFRVRYSENQSDIDALASDAKLPKQATQAKQREFDVGFSDRKTYLRKDGVEVELAKNNIGIKLKLVGKGARQTLINEVCKIESRRKRSVYTGCGITRKSRVGKKKLKPTKVRTV